MLKRKKLSQYQKDRIKEVVIKVIIITIVCFVVLTGVAISFQRDDVAKTVLLVLIFAVPIVGLIAVFVIDKTVKTVRKRYELKCFEFMLSPHFDFEKSFSDLGSVKMREGGKNDFYVVFSEKTGLMSQNIVVASKIDVDKNYTQKDYLQFMDGVRELSAERRMYLNDDHTHYEMDIRVIIFNETERSSFVRGYLAQQRFAGRKYNIICIYNAQSGRLRVLKNEFEIVTKRQINRIFRTDKFAVVTEKIEDSDYLDDEFIDPLNTDPGFNAIM